ncbi:MAG: FKBP-type peptidyl-prolyl cis-trans isomerase [Candidatus Microsaccharimonas sp.]
MATKRSQRIAIWVIAITMAVGTIGSFLIIILQNNNQQTDTAKLNDLMSAYQKEVDAYQEKVNAQAAELSQVYFTEFNQYSSRPAVWDAASATELKKEDLKIGDGEEITADSSFSAYYIGWTPDGNVFDGSINGDALKAPFAVTPGGVIQGWTDGVIGMKVGGVRELTIPSDLAYGETGSGETIAPNTPLKFVIMIIPTPEAIPEPQPSAELIKLYTQSQGQ